MRQLLKMTVLAMATFACGLCQANQISADFVKKEMHIAHSQYLKGSLESGLYALEALARILESDTSATLQSSIGPHNLAFTYLRIGLLHEKSGNQQQAETFFNKAISAYQDQKVTITQLKDAVNQMDQKLG